MASKKDSLPVSITTEADSTGTITYANEVIAIIAGVAANEVEGIAGMCSGGGFSDVFIRSRNIRKGVKVEIGAEEASVDLYVIVEYGTPIQVAAKDVQDSVRKAIETMTGLHVVRVDVHVNGVSFEKEKLEEETYLENARLADIPASAPDAKPDDKPEDIQPEKTEKPAKEDKTAETKKPAEVKKPAAAKTPAKAEETVKAEPMAEDKKPAPAPKKKRTRAAAKPRAAKKPAAPKQDAGEEAQQ